jgi:hypothetical protein
MYFAAAVPDLVGRRKLSAIRRNITMAATLQQILLAPDTRPQVIADAYTLLERELAEKSGVSGTEVSQDLLLVTDARAAASSRPTVIKAYRTVRNSAAKHVQAALPQVADLVLKYAP